VLGGLAPAAVARSAAPVSEGWVAPLFGFEVLRQGIAAARDADVVHYPCSGDLDQVERLSQALGSAATVPDA
jgi:hypothetical protein